MRIGILGTGMVGNTIGSKLVELGHDVMMGSRSADNPKAAEWARLAGKRARHGAFADAAQFGEIVFNCTTGMHSIEVLQQSGKQNLAGKILIDVSNPLIYKPNGFPTLGVSNTDSLGEQIQRELPDTRVVKALNTVSHPVMVNPRLLPGEHDLLIAGNDSDAKARVRTLLADWFGWNPDNVIDLGDITACRAIEMWLPIWIRLWSVVKGPFFNLHLVVARPGRDRAEEQ